MTRQHSGTSFPKPDLSGKLARHARSAIYGAFPTEETLEFLRVWACSSKARICSPPTRLWSQAILDEPGHRALLERRVAVTLHGIEDVEEERLLIAARDKTKTWTRLGSTRLRVHTIGRFSNMLTTVCAGRLV